MPIPKAATMPEPKAKAPAPFSLRLTPEERRQLDERAGRQPVGAYIRARLFGDAAESGHKRRTRRPFVVADHKALSQVLALLGRSRLASNLNQLARAANCGALPVTPDTEAALTAAGRDIAEIKALLMTALGIRER